MVRSVVVWLRKALADRDEQIDFIAEDSPRTAVEQGDRIAHQVSQLAQHPELPSSTVRTAKTDHIAFKNNNLEAKFGISCGGTFMI